MSEDAVPTIFPNCPLYLSSIPRKRRKIERTEVTQNFDQYENTSSSVSAGTSTATQEENLFESIWDMKYVLDFPNQAWTLTRLSEDDKAIVLMKTEIISGIPVTRKKIVVLPNMNFKLYFEIYPVNFEVLNINSHVIDSVTDLENLVKNFDEVVSCDGIEDIKTYKSLHMECATKDLLTNRWHHKKCVYISKKLCQNCRTLKNSFRMQAARRNVIRKNITLKGTKEALKKIRHKKTSAISRLKKKCDILQKHFIDQQKSMSNISQEALKEKISKLNLPTPQLLLIDECIRISEYKSKNCRRYTEDWLLLCLLFHIRNPSAYKFMRTSDILPLPAPCTIRRYMAMIDMKCGLDESFFTALKKKMSSKEDHQKHGILVFDEMSVRTSRDVNVKTMKFNGVVDFGDDIEIPSNDVEQLADHALVFLFSSLGENFKQPVAVYAAKNATKGILLSKLIIKVIIKLEQAGAFVDGVICDGASTNRNMWKHLGVTGDLLQPVNKIKHPVDDARNLFFFSDAPHLIKCVRNCMHRSPHLMASMQMKLSIPVYTLL